MFEGLQKKWKVKGLQLLLILITFAVGGSLTGYIGRKLMPIFGIEQKWLWIIVYILLIVVIWPLAVLLISLLTGQYRFFSKYIIRIGRRMGIVKRNPARVKHIAIFASGAGSNAQKIIEHFDKTEAVKIALIVCNNPQAGVLAIAAKYNIPTLLLEKERFFRGDHYINELKRKNIDFIVLAGFLWKLPSAIIDTYPRHIINIHPALLPKYGGKGMYGDNVHAAVIAAGDKESGITIHYVDEQYDHGNIIFQAKCEVLPGDSSDSLANRVHKLEHENYPVVIEELLNNM